MNNKFWLIKIFHHILFWLMITVRYKLWPIYYNALSNDLISNLLFHIQTVHSQQPTVSLELRVPQRHVVLSILVRVESMMDYPSYSTMIQLLVFIWRLLSMQNDWARIIKLSNFSKSLNCPWTWILIIVFYNKDNSFIISYLTKIIYEI